MGKAGGFVQIVNGRCSLCAFPEFRNLRAENKNGVGDWIFEDILCRWGTVREFITDNGGPFVSALEYLAQRYKIYHIRVSGYNHRANGIVERSHIDVREAIWKAADGDKKKWFRFSHTVYWAERVTIKRRMGCSPYFGATGTHPVIPLDFFEATYILPPPESVLSSTDLLARRAITLQKRKSQLKTLYSKVYEARRKYAIEFEERHRNTIHDFDFQRGALVLMRNSAVETSHSKKMEPRYLGPLIVVSRNHNAGAYVICELDGSVIQRPIAAFRLLPYFARTTIPLPDNFLDIDAPRLRRLEQTTVVDD
jgi:hypothetical protein